MNGKKTPNILEFQEFHCIAITSALLFCDTDIENHMFKK